MRIWKLFLSSLANLKARTILLDAMRLLRVRQEEGQINRTGLDGLRDMANARRWVDLEREGLNPLRTASADVEALEFIAYSLQQAGQFDKTARVAASAAARFPGYWIFHFLGGVALKETGKITEACQYLRRAHDIAPKDRQTTRLLVETLAVSQGIEAAAAEARSFSEANERSPDVVRLAPISNLRTWASQVGLSLIEAGTREEIPFKPPHLWGEDPTTETTIALSNKPYVAELNDARIFSKSSIVLTSDGTALSETAGDPDFGQYVSLAYEAVVLAQQSSQVLLDLGDYKTREIDAGIFLSGLGSDAFGHWLPEFLPKLEFLQAHPDFSSLPLIVDAGMPESHFDHLRRLTDKDLILLHEGESFVCRRLIVAPPPTFLPTDLLPNDIPVALMPGLSPRALRFLQAGKPRCDVRHRRIFLGRKNMKWRRLVNEAEIAEYLQDLRFEVVYIEDLRVAEQIQLFAEAAWIVAPNGSALLNLIFADTAAKLLVLTQPNLFNWGTFQGPMEALGYQTLFVAGDFAITAHQKHSDYHIPVGRVHDALVYLGLNEAVAAGE